MLNFIKFIIEKYYIINEDGEEIKNADEIYKRIFPKKEKIEELIKSDISLDTSDTGYILTIEDEIESSNEEITKKLIMQLGEPVTENVIENEHSREFKLKFGEIIYSIYDWKLDEEKVWHIASEKPNKITSRRLIRNLMKD